MEVFEIHTKVMFVAVLSLIAATLTEPAFASALPASTPKVPECQDPTNLQEMLLSNSIAGVYAPLPSTSNNDDGYGDGGEPPLRLRAVCPWKNVENIDSDRYPSTIIVAECLNVTWSGGHCRPVQYEYTTLHRTGKCVNEDKNLIFGYRAATTSLPVACEAYSS